MNLFNELKSFGPFSLDYNLLGSGEFTLTVPREGIIYEVQGRTLEEAVEMIREELESE